MQNQKAENRSILLMVITSLLWSIGGVFIKALPWNALVIAGVRGLIAAATVFVFMRIKKMKFRISRHTVRVGVMLALTYLLFVPAAKMTSAANSIVLQFTSPVFIILISAVLYRQRFAKADYLVVVLTLVGVTLCFLDKLGGGGIAGDLLAICSGFTLGAMYVFSGKADTESRFSGILLGQILTAVVGIPFAFFTEVAVNASTVGAILILGVIQVGIPYILLSLATEHCPPLVLCLVGALEPLLNPVWVALFSGEVPGILSLIGGIVVITTVTVWNVQKGKRPAQVEDAATSKRTG